MYLILIKSNDDMTYSFDFLEKPKITSQLDVEFSPPILYNKGFVKAVKESGNFNNVRISIERSNGQRSTFQTVVFNDSQKQFDDNCFYIERLIKSLLWIKGGWKIIYGGPLSLGDFIKKTFSKEIFHGVSENDSLRSFIR